MKQLPLFALFLFATLSSANAQWELQESHTFASLRGIHNVGGGAVWARGTEGTVLHTVDGGNRWQLCATPAGAEHLDFRGVQAFDKNIAIVMSSGKGDLSRLYKTTDGCLSWKLVLSNPDNDGFLSAFQFRSDAALYPTPGHKSGVVIGDPVGGRFVIHTTRDPGDTWQLWGPRDAFRPAQAADGETLFAASNSAVIAPGVNGTFAFVTGGKGGPHLFLAEPHSPFDASFWWAFSTIKLPMPSGSTSGAFRLRLVGCQML